MKLRWDKKPCGCVKTVLCSKHAGKLSKRVLCHFGEDGIVRRG